MLRICTRGNEGFWIEFWILYKELYIKLTCDNFSVGISYTEWYISVLDIPSN